MSRGAFVERRATLRWDAIRRFAGDLRNSSLSNAL